MNLQDSSEAFCFLVCFKAWNIVYGRIKTINDFLAPKVKLRRGETAITIKSTFVKSLEVMNINKMLVGKPTGNNK